MGPALNDDRRGGPPDVPWMIAGVGHGSLFRTCIGKGGTCGPQSPIGSTREKGLFRCKACSEARAARRMASAEAKT